MSLKTSIKKTSKRLPSTFEGCTDAIIEMLRSDSVTDHQTDTAIAIIRKMQSLHKECAERCDELEYHFCLTGEFNGISPVKYETSCLLDQQLMEQFSELLDQHGPNKLLTAFSDWKG